MIMHKIVFAVACCCLALTTCMGEARKPSGESRLVEATKSAVESTKSKVNKAANAVESNLDGMIVKVEKIVDPPVRSPGQSRLPMSAARGVGRYASGVALETGRAVSNVTGVAYNYVKNLADLTKTLTKEGVHRLVSGRVTPPTLGVSSNDDSGPDVAGVNPKGGQEPVELQANDDEGKQKPNEPESGENGQKTK